MTPDELKHLDYIQSTITRMSSNQFQIKGWLIAIDTAILTIFANSFKEADGPNPYFLLMAIFPTLMFWIMDSRFLSMERRLRKIYEDVAAHKETVKPFDMPIKNYSGGSFSILKCMVSFGNILVYFATASGFLAAFIYFMVN